MRGDKGSDGDPGTGRKRFQVLLCGFDSTRLAEKSLRCCSMPSRRMMLRAPAVGVGWRLLYVLGGRTGAGCRGGGRGEELLEAADSLGLAILLDDEVRLLESVDRGCHGNR